jgi:hypothetical protein
VDRAARPSPGRAARALAPRRCCVRAARAPAHAHGRRAGPP